MNKLLLFQVIGMLIAVAPTSAQDGKVRVDKAGWTEDDSVMEMTPDGVKSNIFASRPDKTALPTRISMDVRVIDSKAIAQK